MGSLTVEQFKNIRVERARQMTVAEMKGLGKGETDITDTRNGIYGGEYAAGRTSSITDNYSDTRTSSITANYSNIRE